MRVESGVGGHPQLVAVCGLLALALSSCATFNPSEKSALDVTPVERVVSSESPLESANRLYAAEDYEAAAAMYARVSKAERSQPEVRFPFADALRRSGAYDAALGEYAALMEAEAWRASALEGMGQVYLVDGDHNAAFEAFSASVERDPGAWRAQLGLAQLRDLARDWARADAAYAAAHAASPNNALVLNNEGVSMLARGETTAAIKLFEKAISHEPQLSSARTNLAIARAANGEAINGDVGDGNSRELAQQLNNAGYVAMLQKRYVAAERLFKAAMKAHPSFYAKAFENLSILESLVNNPQVETAAITISTDRN